MRYDGIRNPDGARVYVQHGSTVDELPMRLDLRSHSPTGFEWGYGGSGPAQLALALCAHATGDDERALRVYQRVKESLVAAWKGDHWLISREEVLAAVLRAEGAAPELASSREQPQQPTPGPWVADGLQVRAAHVVVCEVEDNVHADYDNTTEIRANARLIAAAPELLAALESFLRAPSIGSSGPGSISIEVQTLNLDAARAALRKAKEGA